MSQPPSSLNADPDMNGGQYNGKIIIASLSMLCFVILFILALHIYAKWFWRRSTRRQQALWRRRLSFHLHGQEAITVGLDKAVVDSLPTFIYNVDPQEGAMECAVCLSEFQENDKGRLLPKCNHSFHTDCIDMWFLSHTTCPLCRSSAEPGEARPLSNVGAMAEELEMSISMRSDASDGLTAGAHTAMNAVANSHLGFQPLTGEGDNGESLPSPGWSWRRSISDRFSQNAHAGVQFPTNVLFWGNNSHVTSHTSTPQAPAPCLEHGQRGARSLPHMAIEIPRRSMHNAMASRCVSGGAAQGYPSLHNEQTSQPQGKAPGAGLNVFKRLLSRERKVFPSTEQEMGGCGHGIGTSSGAMASGS